MAQNQSVLPRANDLLQLAACPVQVIEHPGWTAARDAALALLAAGPCVIVLLGSPGSGKTMLLRNLAVALGAQGRTACVLDFGDSQGEVGPAEIVLVDEADRISAARLDELLLSEHGARALVLAALPSAGERFRRYPGAIVIEFATLSPDQACAFLAERLAQLGLPVHCLTEAAWAGLVAHGRGVPRLLIALLGLALFVAAEDDAGQVTGAHVEQAVAVRIGGTKPAGEEPEGSEPDFAAPGGAGVPVAADQSTEVATGGVFVRRRSGWPAPLAAALLAACLLVPAALLTGSRNQEGDRPRPPDSSAQAVARVEAAPEPIAQNTPPVATAAPEAPATAGVAPTPLVSQPPAPADATAGASRQVVPPAPAAAGSAASPPSASATADESASQAVTPPVPATPVPVVPPPPTPAVGSEAASQQTSSREPTPVTAVGKIPELPAGALIHIVLIYPRGDRAAAQRGRDLAQVLRSAGLGVGDPFPVASRASKRGISYYFAQDEDAAGEIGRRLAGGYGGGKLVRPPRGAGLPRPGTIEIAVGSD